MSRWVRLDADYFSNPRAVAAGLQGRALHLASICWSAQHLEDGMIPPAVIPTLLHQSGVRRGAVDRLVDTGLWIPIGECYEIKSYAEKNQSRAQVEQERERWKLRQQKRRALVDGLGHADVTP